MPHLWPTVTRTSSLKQGYAGSGITVDQGLVSKTGAHMPVPHCASHATCEAAFAKASGYFNTYHPSSHYWPLQLTTSAVLLAVAGLLMLASFLVLRRRTA